MPDTTDPPQSCKYANTSMQYQSTVSVRLSRVGSIAVML